MRQCTFSVECMGVMLPQDHGLAKGRAGKSDRYYESLCKSGLLAKLLQRLVPDRTPACALDSVRPRPVLPAALSAARIGPQPPPMSSTRLPGPVT